MKKNNESLTSTMTNKRIIDISTWERKEHYAFFGGMADPYIGLTASVDFTECFRYSKTEGRSFFLLSLYRILKSLNAIPELRCRIEDGQIVCYDKIGASPTIAREDGSFGFAYFDYYEDFDTFECKAKKEIERVNNGKGLSLNENENRSDIVYFTSIPWVNFTEIKHAGTHSPENSIPEIAVGKLIDDGDRKRMSVSIMVNHGLADGRHIGMFFDAL